MALKTVHVSDVPNLDHVIENVSLALYLTGFHKGIEMGRGAFTIPKFVVIGHRGNVMNMLHSGNRRMKVVKENSIISFNTAANFPIDFVEFDVHVTRDDCPVIFHDNSILSEENGIIFEKRVAELSLCEFLAYGPQREPGKAGKSLLRKTKDGKIVSWDVETDDASCTLQEAFQTVKPFLGFNIGLKFDDHIVYQHDYLIHVLQCILRVVFEHATDRPILIFSTFQPDAALLVKKLQSTYPLFFLTNGGTELYDDVRRNSLEQAIKLCLEGGLEWTVSEVILLHNVPEAVYMQHLMGIKGVIVDLVQEITEAVSDMINPPRQEDEVEGGEETLQLKAKPQFSQIELSILFKLIPGLTQL